MVTFTSSLPENLLKELSQTAKQYKVPKNKIIEKALSIYLDQLKRAEYVKSYKALNKDEGLLKVAEEGMKDYAVSLPSENETR